MIGNLISDSEQVMSREIKALPPILKMEGGLNLHKVFQSESSVLCSSGPTVRVLSK